jgi:hypothetical protein
MDTGDLNGVMSRDNRQVIFQCKNQKTWNMSGWLNATVEQASNNTTKSGMDTRGVLLVKRRGVGDRSMGSTYAVMQLEDLSALLQEAGYE